MNSRDDDRRSQQPRSRSRSRSRDRENGESNVRSSSFGLPGVPGATSVPQVLPPISSSAPTTMGMIPGIQAVPQVTAVAATSALSSILAAQQAAQDKVNRELFVGNTPQGTSEMLLIQFLNGAMRRIGLCPQDMSPILQCRVNQKFAFVECQSIEYANKALNLNGIPFLGACLKVSRPSKYTGPFVASKTWQELTGQPVPANMTPVDSNLSSAEEKVNRELFIGNTTPEMTEQMLKDFLGKAMEQVGLSSAPGNPITACRVSGKFAFIELRSKEEAAKALNLNNIPYLGAQLRVGRPSKYTGAVTQHGNWEDILAKYMSGELQLPAAGGAPAAAAAVAPPMTASAVPPTQTNEAQTKVVEIRSMLTAADFEDEDEYEEILEDTKDECSQFGVLKSVVIPKSGPGFTKVFLEYNNVDEAAKAINGLAGRTFDGRRVAATYFDETKYANEDYSD